MGFSCSPLLKRAYLEVTSMSLFRLLSKIVMFFSSNLENWKYEPSAYMLPTPSLVSFAGPLNINFFSLVSKLGPSKIKASEAVRTAKAVSLMAMISDIDPWMSS